MNKKRLLTYRGELIMDMATWEKQEVVRLLKGAPGTQYQEADDVNKAIIRDWIKSLLQRSTITVTFVKADGTVREMLCTLDSSRIPAMPDVTILSNSTANVDGLVESKKPRKQPDPHSIRVYDLEKAEWRSFRFDRLKKITAELKFE
jgi:hypothetical protein